MTLNIATTVVATQLRPALEAATVPDSSNAVTAAAATGMHKLDSSYCCSHTNNSTNIITIRSLPNTSTRSRWLVASRFGEL